MDSGEVLDNGNGQIQTFGGYANGEVFRHKLTLIPEETEGLTEAFKSKLGLCKRTEIADENDVQYHNDVCDLAWLKDKHFSFDNFKKLNFQKDFDITKPLTSSLLTSLSNQEPSISVNCVVISHAIKIFCKDIQPLKTSNKKISNVLSLVYQNLAIKDSEYSKSGMNVMKSKSPSLLTSIPHEDFPLMQFILSYGVLNSKLRNEVYSQLCMQVLGASSSEEGKNRAWLLHLLCVGCFLPNKMMIKHYISFLNDFIEKQEYAKYTLKQLQRTHLCGPRHHPVNSLEFKAAKALKKMMLPVMLADGRSVSVQTDSASTASEICSQICKYVNITDQFGFALYISIDDKVSSLGSGSDHVMDAIGECEQVSTDAKWSLFFAKEIFTPWHDAEFDAVSTSLIYCQIIKSVLNHEVKFKSDEDLARFLARRCYVETGASLDDATIRNRLKVLLPKKTEKMTDEGKWCKLVLDAFQKMEFHQNSISRDHVKWSIVEGAQIKWPLQFAALFEVHKVSVKPVLSNNDVVLAISCRGIFLLQEPFKLLCGLHYYEIIEVNCIKGENGKDNQISIMTTEAGVWKLECTNAEIVCKILASFIDGLRRRSRWAVALHHFILRDHTKNDKDDFRLKQGDIVQLLDESSQGLPEDWMFGRCERTNLTNRFPYDCVYIFPTTKKPPKEFLSIFGEMSQKDVNTLPRKRATIVLKKDTISSTALQHTFI